MQPSPIEPSDDELSDIIDDNAISENTANVEEGGFVEAGVPPPVDDQNVESVPNDESFGADDFEDDDATSELADSTADPVDLNVSDNVSDASNSSSSNGTVAQFRESLSSLSRQLELDRLAFLHKRALESGKDIASLTEIAGDIDGSSPIFPAGDFDFYDKRPTARLDGWVAGLSFGANRRAKKFSK
jgi:hypothetical protein|tara:strand:- start:686 stop:1246 length:561 start_codon:yes stop_codon:yes gene_type:complete